MFDLPEKLQEFQRREAFYGMELVQDTHRLALMNAMMHDIQGDIVLCDSSRRGSAAKGERDTDESSAPC